MHYSKIPKKKTWDTGTKLFNFRPVLFSTVFFAFGIFCAMLYAQYRLPWWLLLFLLPIAALPFFFTTTKKERIQRAIAVSVMALFFAAGFGGFCIQTGLFQAVTNFQGEHAVRGKVTDYVVYDEYTYMELTNVCVDGSKQSGKLIAYLPGDYAIDVPLSSTVECVGYLRTDTRIFDANGFRGFAVDKNVRLYLTADTVRINGREFDLFLYIRQGLENVVEGGMNETPAQTLLGLLFGETSGMDEGLLENVRYGGIAHIFAVSGLHFGILFACLSWIFNRECLWMVPRWLRFGIVAFVLFFYGGICGYSASVIRAIVTCLSLYAASLVGIETDWLERLSFACLLVLFLSPCQLFHAGFLLSFGACYGIAFLARRIEKGIWICWGGIRRLVGKPVRKYFPHEQTHPLTIPQTIECNIISFLSVTTSAQAFTLPILMTTFGYVSGWSLLLNCIFVPIISIVFPFLLVFVVIAAILPTTALGVVLHVPNLIMTLLTFTFETVDFTGFALSGIRLTAFALLCYYFALLLCTDKWNAPRKYTWILALASILCFVATVWITNA